MAHGQAGERDARRLSRGSEREARHMCTAFSALGHRHLVADGGHVGKQIQHFARILAAIHERGDMHRRHETRQVFTELRFDFCFQHDYFRR